MINLGQVRNFTKHLNADHARKFSQHMVPHVVRPAQIIWNRVIGLIFLVFAAEGISAAYKSYQLLGTDPGSRVRLYFAVPFCILMLCFGIGAFWRARKLSRK